MEITLQYVVSQMLQIALFECYTGWLLQYNVAEVSNQIESILQYYVADSSTLDM